MRSVSLTNAQGEPDIQAALTPYGYTPERLAEGETLLARAEEEARTQEAEYAEQYAATTAYAEAVATLRAAYVRHIKLARIAFDAGTPACQKLSLKGPRSNATTTLVAQAEAFYRMLQRDPALQATLATFTVDDAATTTALGLVDAVKTARAEQVRERGEAQRATHARDAAVADLRGYLTDLRRIAEIALEDQPQAREKLGLLER